MDRALIRTCVEMLNELFAVEFGKWEPSTHGFIFQRSFDLLSREILEPPSSLPTNPAHKDFTGNRLAVDRMIKFAEKLIKTGFERYVDKSVTVVTTDGTTEYSGILKSIDDQAIYIEWKQEHVARIASELVGSISSSEI